MSYFILLAGLLVLVFAGDALVRAAITIAVRLHIPHLIIGLTIVAFGTSAPELLISLRSAFEGVPGLAVGNVVGSNIANIWLVLGLPALIAAICCNQKFVAHNMMFMIFMSLVFVGLSFYGTLTFWHGLILFALLIIFLIDCAVRAKRHKAEQQMVDAEIEELIEAAEEHTEIPLSKTFLILALGVIGLAVGAEMTVMGAIDVAKSFGVSDATIGLTVVAVGTSLPELAATIMAAFRNHAGLALGNAIGSNIYNIGAVIGLTAMITPLTIDPIFKDFDFWIMLLAAITIVPFILMKTRITRVVGLLFLMAYAAYIYKVVEMGRLQNIEQTLLMQEAK